MISNACVSSSLDVLRAREIIPPPPAPPMVASSAGLDGHTMSSAAPLVKVKREREEASDSSDGGDFSDEEEAVMYARLKVRVFTPLSSFLIPSLL